MAKHFPPCLKTCLKQKCVKCPCCIFQSDAAANPFYFGLDSYENRYWRRQKNEPLEELYKLHVHANVFSCLAGDDYAHKGTFD